MSKILALTGMTGKSGSALAEVIGENPDEVNRMFPDGIRALVRATSNTRELEKWIPNVEKVVGSLESPDVLKKAFQDVDTVIHVAGIHWSREVVQAAAACHVRRLIMVHTTGIYSKYKAAGEEYRRTDAFVYSVCRENGIALTVLRPTMIYGNTSDKNVVVFIKMVDKLPIMPVVNGAKYELQPVHYKDLGDAYYKVLMNEETTANRDFILSGGAPIQLRDMLSEIGRDLGKKVRFISCPFWIAYSGACILYYLSFKKKDFREKVQRLCEPRTFSFMEAEEAFGYSPRPFPDGVKDEVKEYLEKKEQA
ncbi:MAG: NAD(P)H-binding protein [Oscillospiraceae bacterium]|nr:NAD(P)H-binding protein [Oscillospiraceae bacterium]